MLLHSQIAPLQLTGHVFLKWKTSILLLSILDFENLLPVVPVCFHFLRNFHAIKLVWIALKPTDQQAMMPPVNFRGWISGFHIIRHERWTVQRKQ